MSEKPREPVVLMTRGADHAQSRRRGRHPDPWAPDTASIRERLC